MVDRHTASGRSGRFLLLIFVACVGLLAFGLYLQHWENLDPCPWCVVQRLGYILIGLIALAGALQRPGVAGTVVYASLGLIVAAAGIAAAGYQIYLQADAARAAKCAGSLVEQILDQSRVGKLIPALLQYDGPCTLKTWSLLGLSIPEWSAIWFVIFACAFVIMLIAARR